MPAYTATARALHWLVAALVITMIALGILMGRLPGGFWQNLAFDLHRSIGVIVFPIVLFRLYWRITHRPSPLPADIPRWQVGLSHAVHWSLYLLLLANSLLGWIATSAYPAPITVFWLFTMPPAVGPDRALSEQLLALHANLGLATGALVLIHIAAALYHHFVRRDGVLRRMWPGSASTA